MIDLDKVAEDVGVASDEALSKVATMVKRQRELEAAVTRLEENLAYMKEELRRHTDDLVPRAMAEAGGITRIDVEGLRVEVKPVYEASISRANAEQAFAWLRAHGHEDLIKNEVKVSFGRGEDEAAREVERILRERGVEPEARTTVHPQTLKAFVREQMEAGADLPHDLLGIYSGQRARITKGN